MLRRLSKLAREWRSATKRKPSEPSAQQTRVPVAYVRGQFHLIPGGPKDAHK